MRILSSSYRNDNSQMVCNAKLQRSLRLLIRQMIASNGLSTCSRLDHQRSRRRALVCLVYTQRKCRTLFAAISLLSCRCVSFCVVLLLCVTAASVASVACCPVAPLRKAEQGTGKRQEIETISTTLHPSPWFGNGYLFPHLLLGRL